MQRWRFAVAVLIGASTVLPVAGAVGRLPASIPDPTGMPALGPDQPDLGGAVAEGGTVEDPVERRVAVDPWPSASPSSGPSKARSIREPADDGDAWRRPDRGRRPVAIEADREPARRDNVPRAALAVPAVVSLALGGLYHRIGRDDVLENPVREAIYEEVRDDPGGTTTEYADAVDVDRTTARYHLDTLERCDLVVVDRVRGSRRFFENHGRYGQRVRQVVAWLRHPTNRAVLEAVVDRPGSTYGELARRVDLSKSAVYRKVSRLREWEVVSVDDASTPARVEVDEDVDLLRAWMDGRPTR